MRETENKKVILVVSFGTTYKKSREAAIGSIEREIATAYPEFDVRRAFTSPTIIRKLRERDGEVIDNVSSAMERMIEEGIDHLIIQPTYVLHGYEYDAMINTIARYEKSFSVLRIGTPLLSSDQDYEEMVKILTNETKGYQDNKTAIVYMGHGTGHTANVSYEKLDRCLKSSGCKNYFIGTVEAAPSLNDVKAAVKAGDYKRVVLLPLMIVAGDHACSDMAGDHEGSWAMAFRSQGYQVLCELRGMGEYTGIQRRFAEHVREALVSAF